MHEGNASPESSGLLILFTSHNFKEGGLFNFNRALIQTLTCSSFVKSFVSRQRLAVILFIIY